MHFDSEGDIYFSFPALHFDERWRIAPGLVLRMLRMLRMLRTRERRSMRWTLWTRWGLGKLARLRKLASGVARRVRGSGRVSGIRWWAFPVANRLEMPSVFGAVVDRRSPVPVAAGVGREVHWSGRGPPGSRHRGIRNHADAEVRLSAGRSAQMHIKGARRRNDARARGPAARKIA